MRIIYPKLVRTVYFLISPLTKLFLHNSRRVRVLIQRDKQILLQRTALGSQKWSLPGGGVKKNEDPFTAAVRETKEETNISLIKNNLICIGEDRVSKGIVFPKIDLLFYYYKLTDSQIAKVIRPLEIFDLGWFSLSNLPKNRSSTVDIALKLQKKVDIKET